MNSPSPEKQHFFHNVRFTRSCSFCFGSGSLSVLFVNFKISGKSYTRIIRSAVLTRNELPRLANSICFIAAEVELPLVTLNVVNRSRVFELNTLIYYKKCFLINIKIKVNYTRTHFAFSVATKNIFTASIKCRYDIWIVLVI